LSVVHTHELSETQDHLLQALESGRYRYLGYGGGFSGGKSYLACLTLIASALRYPRTRYGIVRKTLTSSRKTSLLKFREVLEELQEEAEWNGSELCFTFPNGSTVYFLEADEGKDPNWHKLRLELTACVMEEADEMAEGAFNHLMGRIGRCNTFGDVEVPAFILCTFNPAQNWVKKRFYDPFTEGKLEPPYFFVQALPSDNPFNPEAYLDGLKDMPEAEYQRFVLGNWNFSDDPNQLIPYEKLRQVFDDRPYVFDPHVQEYLGVDVARYGKDSIMFQFLQDTWAYPAIQKPKQRTDQTGQDICFIADEKGIGSERIGVDVGGLGAGTVDYCYSQNLKVFPYNAGSAPQNLIHSQHYAFANFRAESYWMLKQDIEDQVLTLANVSDLVQELTALRYFIKDRTIHIESKDEMKKRLGKSPDRADALCIANTMRHRHSVRLFTPQATVRPTVAPIVPRNIMSRDF